MGADNTYGEVNFNPETNNCQGEWINDCPYVECKCAKKALDDMHELEEDYSAQSVNTAWSTISWILIIVLLLGSLIYGLIQLV